VPSLKNPDLFRVEIQEQHIVAYFGQTSPTDQPHITCPDDCDFHDDSFKQWPITTAVAHCHHLGQRLTQLPCRGKKFFEKACLGAPHIVAFANAGACRPQAASLPQSIHLAPPPQWLAPKTATRHSQVGLPSKP
jgi:hypothetical protein